MPADNRGDLQHSFKDLYVDFAAGRIRQGWNGFVENYRRRRFGADWEQRQVGQRECFFMAVGIFIGLIILMCVFFFINLIDALDHSFSENGPFKELCAVKTITKKLSGK
ncbi:uncharacterized protein LOC117333114 [Pecten maximus]|uniref:uncharacterized protein LOC117333114 n=1 Tax=Pecten maximus TaxID=6579 RepID=UPI00145914FC|nr:uncharacterized protein LOC117333114 [Pecten maximus]